MRIPLLLVAFATIVVPLQAVNAGGLSGFFGGIVENIGKAKNAILPSGSRDASTSLHDVTSFPGSADNLAAGSPSREESLTARFDRLFGSSSTSGSADNLAAGSPSREESLTARFDRLFGSSSTSGSADNLAAGSPSREESLIAKIDPLFGPWRGVNSRELNLVRESLSVEEQALFDKVQGTETDLLTAIRHFGPSDPAAKNEEMVRKLAQDFENEMDKVRTYLQRHFTDFDSSEAKATALSLRSAPLRVAMHKIVKASEVVRQFKAEPTKVPAEDIVMALKSANQKINWFASTQRKIGKYVSPETIRDRNGDLEMVQQAYTQVFFRFNSISSSRKISRAQPMSLRRFASGEGLA